MCTYLISPYINYSGVGFRMSGQKRPCDSSAPSSSSGAPPDKRREREGGEDGVPGVSATAVETVIKLGGVSNSVRELQSAQPVFILSVSVCLYIWWQLWLVSSVVDCVVLICSVSFSCGQEEQDVKALHVKNRKLGESLDQRQVCQTHTHINKYTGTHKPTTPVFTIYIYNGTVALQVIEDELRERIERLETRQATDDASLLILNRYWNQVTIHSLK